MKESAAETESTRPTGAFTSAHFSKPFGSGGFDSVSRESIPTNNSQLRLKEIIIML